MEYLKYLSRTRQTLKPHLIPGIHRAGIEPVNISLASHFVTSMLTTGLNGQHGAFTEWLFHPENSRFKKDLNVKAFFMQVM